MTLLGHPYGPRPAEQIRQYTWQLVKFLLTKDVKMIVIACNTATAVVWEEIKGALDIPVLGVVLSLVLVRLLSLANRVILVSLGLQ